MSKFGFTDEQYKKFVTYGWITLLAFSILYAFIYNGRLNMGLALPMMEKTFGWNKAQAGVLASVLFWAYGFGHLFNGRLSEIFGVKKFITAGVLLSVAVNLIISFQTTLIAIAILWALNGYFQSMAWSPGMALLARWWPSKDRGFATGFANGFSGVAQVVVWFSVLASVAWAPQWGWAAAFRIPLVTMVIVAVLFAVIAKGSPKDVGLKDYEEANQEAKVLEDQRLKELREKGKLYPYLALFKDWRFVMWCFIVAISSIARYGLLTWIPTYYVEVLNMKVKTGIFASVVLPIGMAIGTFLVPWWTDKFSKGNRLPAVIICSIVSALSVFIFPFVSNLVLAAIGLFIAGFFVYAINGVVWAYSTDVGTRAFSGTAAGVLDWAAYMGAAVQAIIFGGILNATKNWYIVFFSISAICVIMLALAVIANKKPKTIAVAPPKAM